MAMPGRNDPCPCGNGKKYKKCHGSIDALDRLARVQRDAPLLLARVQAAQAQRQSQQGLGKPIISTEASGYRFVAVGKTLHYSKSWKTFHDFLGDYIKIVMGKEWWMGEVAKAAFDRHPILQWAFASSEYQKQFMAEPGRVMSAPMTGAVGALMHTAYDLYAMEHHAELQSLLIKRLKNSHNFAGARYEVTVAARLLRAGFEIELEDETDGTSTHVEFTATHKRSGHKFSVEAKQRDAEKIRVGRLLHRALSKAALHTRMVFIDINEPDTATTSDPPNFLLRVEARLVQHERNPSAAGLPPAFIIVTNSPWHHHPSDTGVRESALFHGFRIPEFRRHFEFQSIRQAVDFRSANQPLFDLMLSMKEHAAIPITFDGANPEFAVGQATPRLVVGERYPVTADAAGTVVDGVLESAIVDEGAAAAVCVLRLDDGRRVINRVPLEEHELRAWRAHPETFFGVLDRNARKGARESALDWYDFFYEVYRSTAKAKLVEWMTGPMDRESLEQMEQQELARLYCEGLAAKAWSRDQKAAATSKP